MLKYIIQGLLMQNDDRNGLSGYDINQYMKDYPVFKAGFGNIYPALKKLEAAGSIKSREAVEAGKYKKIYTINEKGKKEFLEWLEQPIKLTKSINDPLAKLYFYQYLSKEKVKILISEFIKRINTAKRSLEFFLPLITKSKLKNKINCSSIDNTYYYQEACLQFGLDQLNFMSGWYQKLLQDLNGGK